MNYGNSIFYSNVFFRQAFTLRRGIGSEDSDGKTHFIGVLFDEEIAASSTNANWPNNYPDDLYSIHLDAGTKLRLSFSSIVNPGTPYELRYDPVELLKFMAKTKEAKLFKFGHLFRNKENYKIVNTSIKNVPWILKIDSVKILVGY